MNPLIMAAKEKQFPRVPITHRPMVAAPITEDNLSDIGWQQACFFKMQIDDMSSLGMVSLNGHQMLTNRGRELDVVGLVPVDVFPVDVDGFVFDIVVGVDVDVLVVDGVVVVSVH